MTQTPTKTLMERIDEIADYMVGFQMKTDDDGNIVGVEEWRDMIFKAQASAEVKKTIEQVRAMRCKSYPKCITVPIILGGPFPVRCETCETINKILAMLGAEKDVKG